MNMLDMMKMMGKLKEMQEEVSKVKVQLKNITVSQESGGGLVKVTANGQREILALEIDDSLVNLKDKQMLMDLIIASINKAIQEADEKASEHMKDATQGMMPNIPGLDNLGKMFS